MEEKNYGWGTTRQNEEKTINDHRRGAAPAFVKNTGVVEEESGLSAGIPSPPTGTPSSEKICEGDSFTRRIVEQTSHHYEKFTIRLYNPRGRMVWSC